jgi:FkbM family methyltransferase
MFIQLSKKIFRKAGYWVDIKSIFEKKNFESFVPDRKDYELDGSKRTIHLKKFGLKLDLSKHVFFLKGLRYADALKKDLGAIFTLQNGEIFVDLQNLRFNIQTKEELYILNEVFVKGDYGYENAVDFVLIDIGMNVGITSLYFSGKENCKKIYSFEPFEETYKQALFNISLNNATDKITAFNFGLGHSERTLEVDYLPEQKGSMGIAGVPKHVNNHLPSKKVALKIRNVTVELAEIMRAHFGNEKIVLKVDCEGAEYEIIPALFKSGLLKQVDVIMMEWHVKGPGELLRYLNDAGFSSFSFNSHSDVVGAVYCIRGNDK